METDVDGDDRFLGSQMTSDELGLIEIRKNKISRPSIRFSNL